MDSVSEASMVTFFTNGLRPHIRSIVTLKEPRNLQEAIMLLNVSESLKQPSVVDKLMIIPIDLALIIIEVGRGTQAPLGEIILLIM